MSRPPRPLPSQTTGPQAADADPRRLDYLPLEYAELLALQEDLAITELGRPRRAIEGAEEGDVARTFMELSALLGHVLAVYQRTYAQEAFISTAVAAASLVRHARRLAYDPSPGLAANGHVVLVAKEGTDGTVERRLSLASVPLGEIRAQDYESDGDLVVDARLNELEPVEAYSSAHVAATAREVRLDGAGHGIEAGDTVALVGTHWRGFVVAAVTEAEDGTSTTVELDDTVGADIDPTVAPAPRLLAHPRLRLRPFAADADPALFPPSAVKSAGGTSLASTTVPFPRWWYEVQRADGSGYQAADVYLSEALAKPLTGRHVLRSDGASLAVFSVSAEIDAGVTLRRQAEITFPINTVTLTQSGNTWTSQVTTAAQPGKQVVDSHTSGSVTAIQVKNQVGAIANRDEHPVPAEWMTDWAIDLPLAESEPSTDELEDHFDLPGVLEPLRPGRPLVFSNRAETVAQVVAVRRAQPDRVKGVTTVWWDPVGPAPEQPWLLGDLKVFGNVAPVSHGRTVEDTLGGSDGVTPFQRFPLDRTPLTVLPGVAGGEPALEVRVDDVLWTRVADFGASGPDDRHYRSVTDEVGVTTIVFGDGHHGAVPPSGKKNVRAVYRVGLGVEGDVEAGRLTRLKRAHPLLDRVANLTPVAGGAEPAGQEEIRSQATRWIRTFDRAVSVSDLADLALLMPGVARSAARWDGVGAVVVVATATGSPPPAMDAVREFLDARRDVTVPLSLPDPQARELTISVELEPDPAYFVEAVKDSIRNALHGDDEDDPGLFTFAARGLGQPAYLSEVYARLEALPGVVGVRITKFESRGEALADVVPAEVHEWLSLPPNELAINVAGSAS